MPTYKKMALDPQHYKSATGMKEPSHYAITHYPDGGKPSRTLHYSAADAEAHKKTRLGMTKGAKVEIFQTHKGRAKKSGQDEGVLGRMSGRAGGHAGRGA